MISQEIKDLAQKFGKFFLQEKNGDYNAACEEINKLRINDLRVENGKFVIETSRPGRFIDWKTRRTDRENPKMDGYAATHCGNNTAYSGLYLSL